jgi:hypothetical protein
MNNDALRRFFSQDTIEKLEKLAQETTYQWRHGFERQLTLFQLFAFILAMVEEQASQIPMDEPGLLLLELDITAGQRIKEEITAFVDDPGRPIAPHMPNVVDRADTFFEGIRYYFSDDWFARRKRILEHGKGPLLSRIIARMQEQKNAAPGQP